MRRAACKLAAWRRRPVEGAGPRRQHTILDGQLVASRCANWVRFVVFVCAHFRADGRMGTQYRCANTGGNVSGTWMRNSGSWWLPSPRDAITYRFFRFSPSGFGTPGCGATTMTHCCLREFSPIANRRAGYQPAPHDLLTCEPVTSQLSRQKLPQHETLCAFTALLNVDACCELRSSSMQWFLPTP